MRYDVLWFFGLVTHVDTWSETHVSVKTQGGGGYVSGTAQHVSGYIAPTTIDVQSKVVQKDRMWVSGPDGAETKWLFSHGQFSARASHHISALSQQLANGTRCALIACNHDTGQVIELNGPQHRLPGFGPWLLTTAVGTLGMLLLLSRFFPMALGRLGIRGVAQAPVTAGVVALIYVAIIKAIYHFRRGRRYYKHYFPAYEQFLLSAKPPKLPVPDVSRAD